MSRQTASAARARRRLGRNAVIALPYAWLLLFFLLPFAFVLKISLAEADIAIPPYTALLNWVDDATIAIQLTFAKYQFLLDDRLYLAAYLNSLKIAGITTCFAWTFSAFATPQLIGGGQVNMIGNLVYQVGIASFNFPVAAVLSLAGVLFTMVLVGLMRLALSPLERIPTR